MVCSRLAGGLHSSGSCVENTAITRERRRKASHTANFVANPQGI